MTEQFIQERKYLKAVSPKTIVWYHCSFKAFAGAMESKAAVNQRIVELRERKVSPITINSYLRAVNAYFMWLHKEHGKELIRISKLKEEQKILNTFTKEHVQRLLHFKPNGTNQTRAHVVGLLLLDTGLRISEALGLAKEDCDFDNLILKVLGKGGKQRLVPFSSELRKALWRYVQKSTGRVLFGTKNNTKITVRNFHRDFKELGQKAGIGELIFGEHYQTGHGMNLLAVDGVGGYLNFASPLHPL